MLLLLFSCCWPAASSFLVARLSFRQNSLSPFSFVSFFFSTSTGIGKEKARVILLQHLRCTSLDYGCKHKHEVKGVGIGNLDVI
jgi:hypothetical protein